MKKFAARLMLVTCALVLVAGAACDRQDAQQESDKHAAAQTPADETPADETPADETPDDEAPAEEGHDEHAHQEETPSEQVGQSPTSLDELPEGVNVVQHEMQLLDAAMHATLTLIVNNQLEGIPAQIKKVHPARELTHEALEQGLYEPPKNADKLEEFEKLDDAFHDDLKGLLQASQKDDLQMASEKFGDLVQGCASCHTQYRFE